MIVDNFASMKGIVSRVFSKMSLFLLFSKNFPKNVRPERDDRLFRKWKKISDFDDTRKCPKKVRLSSALINLLRTTSESAGVFGS